MKSKVISGFKLGKRIGSGVSGEVFRARKGEAVAAVKRYYKERGATKFLRHELKALRILSRTKGVAKLLFVSERHLVLGLKLAPGKELACHESKLLRKHFNEWSLALCKIIKSLHSKGISHMDLHGGNIMYDPSETITVLDFTYCKFGGRAKDKRIDLECLGYTFKEYGPKKAWVNDLINKCYYDQDITIHEVINVIQSNIDS